MATTKSKDEKIGFGHFYYLYLRILALRGVVEDLSGLRDRGPGFKTGSRPLTFTKAVTNFRTLHVVFFS
jgi:hypothetical protein